MVTSVDKDLTDIERKVLAFLLECFKTNHSLPSPEEIEQELGGLPFTAELQQKMVQQFQSRGIPYPDPQSDRSGKSVLPFIVNEAFKRGKPPTVDEVQQQLTMSKQSVHKILNQFQQMGVITVNGSEIELCQMLKEALLHEVVLADGFKSYGACAIDALGLPFMFDQDATVHSRTFGGKPIRIEIKGGQIASSEPSNLRVSWNEAQPVCGNTHFFESADEFEAWQRLHPNRPESLIPLAKALEEGQKWIGGRLEPDYAFPV